MSVHRLSRIAFTAVMAAIACRFLSQCSAATPSINVQPLVRSAAFQFRLDEIDPAAYKAVFGPVGDATRGAKLEWKPAGSSQWLQAQDFVRVEADRFKEPAEKPDPRMATMLFGLVAGESYDYRVTFYGPDMPGTPATGRFTTKTTEVPWGTDAKVVKITPATPSVYAAMKAAMPTTDGVYPGKTIEVAAATPGGLAVYRQPIASFYEPNSGPFRWKGTAEGWITIKSRTGDRIVFDGSDPAYDTVNAGKWVPYVDPSLGITASSRIFRTKDPYYDTFNVDKPFAATEALRPMPTMVYFERTPETLGLRLQDISTGRHWMNEQGKQFTSAGLATLKDRATGQPGEGAFVADAGYVYVHLQGGVDPNTVHMKIPVLKSCLDFSGAQYTRLVGVKIRYYRDVWGRVNDSTFGGVHLDNVESITFEDCVFESLGYAIGGRVAHYSPRRNIIIKGCTFGESGLVPVWNPNTRAWEGPLWEHIKHSKEEAHAINLIATSVSVLDSSFSGHNNGITAGQTKQYIYNQNGGAPVVDGTSFAHALAWEIDNNEFANISDDGVEVENWAVCIGVTRNQFIRCYKGISIAPLMGGPQYVLRNVFWGRGEFGASSYKQAMFKFGNNYPADVGYKLIAQNTLVNINDNQAPIDGQGKVLVGISSSGATYNIRVHNNYVYSDAYPVEWGDGALGYPHIFNGNVYVAKRLSVALPGYGSSDCFAIARGATTQNDNVVLRKAVTLDDWQMGKDLRAGDHWPGYQANPADKKAYIRSLHDATRPWLHDPDSVFIKGQARMADIQGGDFRPASGSEALGAGITLANVSFDCGPAWALYNETGRPTAGAYPSTGGTSQVNAPPTAVVDGPTSAVVGQPASVGVTYSDVDGSVQAVTAVVTGPQNAAVASKVEPLGEGLSAVVFTPAATGTYTVKVTVRDDKSATGEAVGTVNVTANVPVEGSLAVQMTASKTNPRPGEPLVYTITVSNPTSRMMSSAVLRQAIPAQMTINTSSVAVDGTVTGGSFSNGTLQVQLGSMSAGQKKTVTVTAIVK